MTATVTILLPGVLRSEADGQSKLTVDTAGSLRSVLDAVAESWPRLDRRLRDERGALRRYVNIYIDGNDCRRSGGLETQVEAGAEIQVLPSVAGG